MTQKAASDPPWTPNHKVGTQPHLCLKGTTGARVPSEGLALFKSALGGMAHVSQATWEVHGLLTTSRLDVYGITLQTGIPGLPGCQEHYAVGNFTPPCPPALPIRKGEIKILLLERR